MSSFMFRSHIIALLALLGISTVQAQTVEWLPDGSEFTTRCTGDGAGERSYRLSVTEAGTYRMHRIGRDLYATGTAATLLFSDAADEFEGGKQTKTMKFLSGDRDMLPRLEVGVSTRGEYEWIRDRSANRVHAIKVEERRTVKTDAFGEQEVFVVTDNITGPIHTIRQETHYSPSLKTWVYRKFENFRLRQKTECNLVSVKRPG